MPPAPSPKKAQGAPGRAPPPEKECRGSSRAPHVAVCNLTFEPPPPLGAAASKPGSRPATQRRPRPPAARPHTPAPVSGRSHGDCQTDAALLEALEIPPAAVATQTEASPSPRPAAPPPAPAGVCASTQVTPEELFDWEHDAAPVVRGLVQQALEAAAVEAQEGLRLAALQRRRRELEEARYKEAAALLRLEQDAARVKRDLQARQEEAERLKLVALQAREQEREAERERSRQGTPAPPAAAAEAVPAFELLPEAALQEAALGMVLCELTNAAEAALACRAAGACGEGGCRAGGEAEGAPVHAPADVSDGGGGNEAAIC